MSSECLNGLEMSKLGDKVIEFFNNSESVQVEEGTWYYHESSVEKELLFLYEQLAKANERVEELEEIYGFFTNENGDYLFDPLTPEKLFQWINKNDIEQKIEVLIFILNRVESLTRSAVIKLHIADHVEQLRKEQP